MDIHSFYDFYDLYELDVKKIYIDENNDLNIVLLMPVYMDYIANGLRSEFDYVKEHTFKFKKYQISSLDFKDYLITKYELKDNSLLIVIDDITIKLI